MDGGMIALTGAAVSPIMETGERGKSEAGDFQSLLLASQNGGAPAPAAEELVLPPLPPHPGATAAKQAEPGYVPEENALPDDKASDRPTEALAVMLPVLALPVAVPPAPQRQSAEAVSAATAESIATDQRLPDRPAAPQPLSGGPEATPSKSMDSNQVQAPLDGPESNDPGTDHKQGSAGSDDGGGKGFSPNAVITSPFRLETQAGVTAGSAVQPHVSITPGQTPSVSVPVPVATAEPLGEQPLNPADVQILLDPDGRMDVTLSAGNSRTADRLRAESLLLAQELSLVGAEVEVIRVELRGDNATNGRAGGEDTAGDMRGSVAADRHDDEAGRHPFWRDSPDSRPGETVTGQAGAKAGSDGRGAITLAGTLDRYG